MEPEKNLALGAAADQSSISQWSAARPLGHEPVPTVYPTGDWIGRARALAADLKLSGVDVTPYLAELAEAERQLQRQSDQAAEPERRRLYFHVRDVMRRLAARQSAARFR